MPYIIDGRTYKVQFANIAAVGAVPSSRVIAAGTGLAGGGDLSANRVISIANGGVGFDQLALSGVTQGTYGSGSAVPILTVDSKGRITSATTAPLDVTGFVPTSRTITAGDGLTGGGSLANNISLAANFSATTPSALGTASAGTAITVSRGDHVHPAVNLSDTSQTQGALPLGRGGTGDALSPVAGAVVYSTGSKFALTNPGIVGQVLVSNGTDEPQWQTILGTGTVTSVSVSTANGFAGFVANPATVPDITLSTTVTGMLKGDGTGMSAATAGVDYVEPGAYTASGLTMASARLLGRTTASVGAAQEITVGTGLTLSGGSLINAAPDQTVSLTAGTAISVTGTYPSFTVTNTAPDQVVSLTGAGTTTVTGTYPSFTITSNDSTSGTVTSVNASGGTTGMSFTGGPVTSAGTLTLNGTLAVSNGGTGATDAATALTNLGAYPASNPAGYTTNVGTVTSVSGTGTVSGLSLSGTVTSAGSLTLGGTLAVLPSNFASQTANTVLAAPNGSAGVPTFRSLVAADVPTLNQNTTGTASNVTGIVAVANGGTGASVAGTARTNLGAAASGANTDITSIALTTGTISTSPVNGTDIVNKAYADSIASGINFHQSVRLATAAALPANTYNNGTSGVGATLTANANGALTVDGVAAVAGNRILVKNEATQANNGVYTVTQVGDGSTPYILTRATDFDSAGTGVDQIDAGDFFLVTAGSTLANTSWVQQTPLPITVGTTAIVFSQFAAPVLYSAGTGLSLTGTTFSITNTGVSASTYGSASSVPVIAVNAQGQITSASASSIAIAASQITSGALAIANGGTGATSAATALTNLGAYPASNPSGFTSNTGTVTSVNLTAGTGVSVSGGPITASGSITVTNTAPDQVVSLTGSGATTVTGTYPNFTISSTAGGAGTVTSINVSGGTTGLTTSGGPVTSSGTITLAGTLNVANGGTGATTLSSGYLVKGNGTSAVSASVVYDNGTNVGIGTASPQALFTISSGAGTKAVWQTTRSFTVNRNFQLAVDEYVEGAFTITPSTTLGGSTYTTPTVAVTGAGNVGIGTSSPSSRLTVVSSTSSLAQFTGPEYSQIRHSDGTRTLFTQVFNNEARLFTETSTPLTFGTNNSERMRITSAGDVGIGTTSPSQKLNVVGNTLIPITNSYFCYTNDYGIGTPDSNGLQVFASNGDVLRFGHRTGGTTFTEDMRIASNGNVGIGTASPGERLTVAATANNAARITSTATTTALVLDNTNANAWGSNIAIATGGTTAGFFGTIGSLLGSTAQDLAVYAATGNGFRVYTNGNNERMRVTSAGLVGIGTASPTAVLNVNGAGPMARFQSGAAADGRIEFAYNTTDIGYLNMASATQLELYGRSGVALAFGAGGSERMRITSAGNVGIGTGTPAQRLDVTGSENSVQARFGSVPGRGLTIGTAVVTGTNDAGVVFNAPTTEGTFIFQTVSTERMRVTSAGNVGIGTSSPAAKLDVTGPDNGGGAGVLVYSANRTANLQIAFNNITTTANSGALTLAAGGATPVIFNTNSTERMRIDSSGNLALGTSTAANRLTVSAAGLGITGGNAINGTNMQGIRLQNTLNDNSSLGLWFGTNNVHWAGISGQRTNFAGDWTTDLRFYTHEAALVDVTYARERMRIDGAGNVGIGTTSPAGRFHALGPAGTDVLYRLEPAYTYASKLLISSVSSGDGGIRYGTSNDLTVLTYSTILFNTGAISGSLGTERMRLSDSGNLGIGTSSPGARLETFNNLGGQQAIRMNTNFAGGNYVDLNPFISGVSNGGYSVSLNGVIQQVISVGGDFGIGISAPARKLDVRSGSTAGTVQFLSTATTAYSSAGYNGASARLLMYGGNSAGSFTGMQFSHGGNFEAFFGAVQNGSNTADFVFQGYSGSFYAERMRINAAGNVGIGTTTPSTKLVVSNSGAAGLEFEPTGGINGGSYIQSYNRGTASYIHNTNYASAQTWYVGNGSRAMDLTSSGQLLIGTTTAVQTLTIGSTASTSSGINLRTTQTDFTIVPSNSAAGGVTIGTSWVSGGQGPLIFTNANGEIMRLSAARGLSVGTTTDAGAGNILASGNVTAYSDIRVKDNVEQIAGALDRIQRIRGVTYTRTDLEDTERRYAGVIAQEIEEVLPEAIFDSGELKAVDYNATIGLLIEAIKELTARVAQLEGK